MVALSSSFLAVLQAILLLLAWPAEIQSVTDKGLLSHSQKTLLGPINAHCPITQNAHCTKEVMFLGGKQHQNTMIIQWQIQHFQKGFSF